MDPEETQVQKQNPFLIPFSIVVAGLLIGGGLYLGSRAPVVRNTTTNTGVESIIIRPIAENDHILGNPNADVLIVEYSDTECPFCKSFHATMKRIMNEYGKDGRVAWVYRHFPIDQLHSKARNEAEATECAAELGGNNKFWEFIDSVFARTPSNDGLDPAELPKIAGDVGLNVDKFKTCLTSGRHRERVQSDYADAVAAGARGTPFSVLVAKNGEKISIEGAQPYEIVRTIIDTALAATEKREN